jgi:hypothetical protein
MRRLGSYFVRSGHVENPLVAIDAAAPVAPISEAPTGELPRGIRTTRSFIFTVYP